MKEWILSEKNSLVEPFEQPHPLPAGGAADAALAEEITGEGLMESNAEDLDFEERLTNTLRLLRLGRLSPDRSRRNKKEGGRP